MLSWQQQMKAVKGCIRVGTELKIYMHSSRLSVLSRRVYCNEEVYELWTPIDKV